MRRTRVRLMLFGAALVCALSVTAIAVASNSTPPVLKSPRNKGHVNPGHVTLRVYSPGLTGNSRPVFVAINRTRKLDKYHQLSGNCSVTRGCDFISMKPWKGHRGWWTYTAQNNFPGYWATTKGKYYWQASHTAAVSQCLSIATCNLVSPIHVFYVR